MGTPRKHHYLPQFYLEGFSPNGRQIWGYSKSANEFHFQAVKDAGSKRDLYSNKQWGGNVDHESVEQRFSSEIESPFAPVLVKLRNRIQITYPDKVLLCRFLQSMHSRVLPNVKILEGKGPDLALKTLQSAVERIRPASPSFSQEKRKELIDKAKEITSHLGKNFPKEALLPAHNSKVLRALLKMNLVFVEVACAFSFVTSDNPFVFDTSVKLPVSDFTFPLSKDLAIVGKSDTHLTDISFVTINRATGRKINRRTISNAEDYIYSTRNSSSIKKLARTIEPIETQVMIR